MSKSPDWFAKSIGASMHADQRARWPWYGRLVHYLLSSWRCPACQEGAGWGVARPLLQWEEINGDGMCPTYLYRWTLLQLFGMAIYLHKFVGDDWSKDLHDHPKRFISIGLSGRYIEHRPGGRIRAYFAPWVRSFPAEHQHRITLFHDRKPCWTLVIVLRATRRWGFWPNGKWIWWRDYVGSDQAKASKACE